MRKCGGCGKFIPKIGLGYCNADCMDKANLKRTTENPDRKEGV